MLNANNPVQLIMARDRDSKKQKPLNWSFTLKDEFILLSKDGEKIGTPPNKMYVCYIEKQTGQKKHFSKGKLLNQNV